MTTYTARITWKSNHSGMRYLERGDRVVIRGKIHEVRDVFTWDGRLVYDTNHGILYADELERVREKDNCNSRGGGVRPPSLGVRE